MTEQTWRTGECQAPEVRTGEGVVYMRIRIPDRVLEIHMSPEETADLMSALAAKLAELAQTSMNQLAGWVRSG